MEPTPDSSPRRPGGLGATFWWLWGGTLLSAFATFVAPFLTVYLTSRGLPPARAGLVAACSSAGALVGLLVAGILADRLGRRTTLLACLLLAGTSAVALALAQAPVAIAAVVFLFGVGTASARAPIRAIVGDIVRPGQLQRAFGLNYWAENVGCTVSFLAAGLLAAHGWSLPFLLDAATTFAFAGVVLWRIPETRPPPCEAAPGDAGYAVVLRDRALLLLLALYVLFTLAYAQAMVVLPLQMAILRFSSWAIGAVMAVSAALVAVVQPFTPRHLARFDHGVVLAAGALLTGAGLGALALCTTPLHFALASLVWTLGEIVFFSTATAAVIALAPASARGRYAAASGLCTTSSTTLATVVGSSVLERFGGPVLWTGSLVLCLAAAAGLLAWRRVGRAARAERAERMAVA